MNELLDRDLDAVMICSPDWLHEEQACAALEAGVPVFLEKPIAITIDGCDRILETAKRTGTKLFVGHNMRYMTIIRKMKALVDSGVIGEVRSVWCRHFVSYGGDAYFRDWHSERRYSTGLLLQKGAHDIDVMHWLTGANSTRVSAFGSLSVYNAIEVELSKPVYAGYVAHIFGRLDLDFLRNHGLMLTEASDLRRLTEATRELGLVGFFRGLNADLEREYSGNQENLSDDEEMATSQFESLEALLVLLERSTKGEEIVAAEVRSVVDRYLVGDG